MNRRRFLVEGSQGVVWGAAWLAAARGLAAPSNKIRVGVMGTGGRGMALTSGFARLPGAEVAYVCDVDEHAVANAVKAVTATTGAAPRGVQDFRTMLDDKSIDAIAIATPDHWHAPAAISACNAGKHVYVEKPCSHNPHEGELLVEAARKHKRVVQMGNQRRSWPYCIEAVHEVHAGAIGRTYYSRSWYTNNRPTINKGKAIAPPAGFNYDLWQGPAPRRPFRDNLVPYNWHWFWHWGTGEAGNNAVHFVDLSRWGLQVDYPTRVTSSGGRYRFSDDWETPDTQTVGLEFGGGKSITWEGLSCSPFNQAGSGSGASFHGENGTLVITTSGYFIVDLMNKEVKRVSAKTAATIDKTGPGGDMDALHLANFTDCIRSGKTPNSEIAEGHKSTMLSLLGNIAQRTGRTLRCDPKDGRILGDKDAMKLWQREYQPGWAPRV